MSFKSLLTISFLVASAGASAVVAPNTSPLLGTYKGDCALNVGGEEVKDTIEFRLDRVGEKFKIVMQSSMQEEASVSILKLGVASIEINEDLGLKTTDLLTITDTELRQWILSSSTSAIDETGIDTTSRIDLDFSKPSIVKMETRGTFGGEETYSGTCLLEKMNVSVK